MNVSFIGLGIMGSRMAKNLVKNGVSLSVANRSAEPLQALVAAGAKGADSYQQAVKQADVVFTMLAKPEVVGEVAFGDQGFVRAMPKNSLWVDCSTVNPSFSKAMAAEAQKAGIRYLEAPVAGTLPHAENAELVIFAGGEKNDLEQVQPLLDHISIKTVHVGAVGMGSSLKMLVNGMLAQSMLVFSEAIALGEKMGLERDFLLNFLPNTAVAAPFLKAKAEMVRADDYEVQFPLELMQKDLHLACQTAYELSQPFFLANLSKELYAKAIAEGLGRLDFSAIQRTIEGQQ